MNGEETRVCSEDKQMERQKTSHRETHYHSASTFTIKTKTKGIKKAQRLQQIPESALSHEKSVSGPNSFTQGPPFKKIFTCFLSLS